ncbi:MAG TPA: MATE family efflux transporter [Synergistaceae bacterium]|nr:MATE family efflux transporter [Synergistaceae bacterium]HPQ37769.1 MATE family efflux transporter [Synergistaceae bacterium]
MHSEKANLGTEPLGRLLWKQSFPSMVGLVVLSLYNLADAVFVGRGIGVSGLAGITVVFPLQIFISAIALALGIGAASLISRSLGAKDFDTARRALGTALGTAVFLGSLLLVGGQLYEDSLLHLFGASREIFPQAKAYFHIILWGAPFLGFAMVGNYALRGEGRALASMGLLVLMAGLNLVLDPLFIFVYSFGLPGVAWATVISQAAAALGAFLLLQRGSLGLFPGALVPRLSLLLGMGGVAFSSFLRSASGSFLVILLNLSLVHYGDQSCLAVAGVLLRLSSFGITPVLGIAQGMQPLLGYNYGASLYSRACKVIWLALGWATFFCVLFVAGVFLFPHAVFRLFSSDSLLVEKALRASRIMYLGHFFVGFQVVGTTVFQALGKGFAASLLSLGRQLLFFLPILVLFPRIWGISGIWGVFPAVDFLTALLTAWLLCRYRKILPGGILKCERKEKDNATI